MKINNIKKAVVTGGLGFIGSHLTKRLLSEGVRVFVIDNHLFGRRKKEVPPHRNLKVFNLDIRNRKDLERTFNLIKPDTIFHLAAVAFIPKCIEDPKSAISTHLEGTQNVLIAAKKVKVKRVYYSSTADVYSPENVFLSEKSLIAPPPDVYGITKLAGELMFEKFHRDTGVDTVVTRFFNVYGPHRTNKFLIPSIAEQISSGSKILELGNLGVERDYIHVDDTVDAIISLMKKTSGFVVANVGSGQKTSVSNLVKLFEEVIGFKIKVISRKQFRRDKSLDRQAWQADTKHISKLVGWKPKISLKNGISDLVNIK